MKALLIALSVVLLCGKALGQAAAPAPKQALPPPPPPPPPNYPPSFRQAEDTPAPPPDPETPIQELKDEGGVTLIIDTEFTSFQSEQVTTLKTTMSEAANTFCLTSGNCLGAYKKTEKEDALVYDTISSSKPLRTQLSFYIKNPNSMTQLTMTSEQLEMMLKVERKLIENSLGYRLDLGDLEFEPFTNGLLLESWLIALICVIALFVLVGIFVGFINYRNKKTDTKLTFEGIEMRHQQLEASPKVLPSGPVVPASSLKKVKVDVSTNVYQAEILSVTKSVFIKPATVNNQVDDDNVLYAVVHHKKNEEDDLQESADPPVSPNSIVVTADVSSSNEDGSIHCDEDLAPPAYEQATQEETKVIEGSVAEEAGASGEVSGEVTSAADEVTSAADEVTSAEEEVTSAADEELPPPPPPEEAETASSASVDLPPPPPPQDDQASGTSSRKESSASSSSSEKDSEKEAPAATPPRKHSGASSTDSSAKASSSGGKEAEEVVGELENLIADQSKDKPEVQGLDNDGFETVLNEEGEPMTAL